MAETDPNLTSAMRAWQEIMQTPELVAYFSGLFNKVGISVEETGEQFTVTHTGTRISFSPGIDPDIDFIVPVTQTNVSNLVSHAQDGKIDAAESWRIVQVLFTPMTQVTLQTPILANNWIRRLTGVEDLIHVYLLGPEGKDQASHTLAFVGGRWQVRAGLHGVPRRTYRITAEQSLDYQRHIFRAIQQQTVWSWWLFAIWYRRWRKRVSTTNR